jgi:hypothetical protein
MHESSLEAVGRDPLDRFVASPASTSRVSDHDTPCRIKPIAGCRKLRHRSRAVDHSCAPCKAWSCPCITCMGAALGPIRGCIGGGEGGIRTLDGLPRTAFPVRRHSPLGDLSPKRSNRPGTTRPANDGAMSPAMHQRTRARTLPRRRGRPRRRRRRAPERSHWKCVSEERRRQRAHWASATTGSGGEGGIRTRGAFAHRFSRAAPSTTRTPLRRRGYQRSPIGPATRDRGQRARTGANSRSASSRRIPLTILIRRGRAGCCASWTTVPAAP